MNCRHAKGLFSPSLDAVLSFEERRKLDAHLERCPACRGEFAKLERTVAWVRDLPELAADEGFVDRVLLAARQARASQASLPPEPGLWERVRAGISELGWSPSPRVAIAALALGLIVGVTGSMLVIHRPSSSTGTSTTAQLGSDAPLETESPAAAMRSPVAETPVPGSIGDLVDEMVRRMEGVGASAADSAETQALDWTPTRDPGATGRVVGSEPTAPGEGRGRGNRVYIVF